MSAPGPPPAPLSAQARRRRWDSSKVLRVQHDSPMGLAVDEGPVGVLYGCEWVGRGDWDVKIAGGGEVSQLGQSGSSAGIGRPERLNARLLRAAVVDDGVDSLSRHA